MEPKENYCTKESAIVALCILATLEAKINSSPCAIVGKMAELKKKGINIGEIYIQRLAGGYLSDTVEGLLTVFILEGLLSCRNPILITLAGHQEFKNMVNNSLPTILPMAKEIGIEVPIK